ncbi:MAG: autotransporter-associated beta strand repeat-containing protein, partial [Chlamydiales bacterium]|nr:autotransporter-associated beta strand repeat-containing protein [Chlamydiales bacterium]
LISGSGGLIKTNGGTLTLSGNNTFSGNSSVSGGTLALGNNNGAGAGSIALANGTTLQAATTLSNVDNLISLTSGTATFDTNSNNLTCSGVISGSGGLTKISGGTLTLSGNNTFSGNTTVSAGILALGNNNGAGSGSIAFSDTTTLRATINLSNVSNPISLTSGNVTFDTNSYDLTSSGVVSGAGNLVKVNGGTLTLSGNNIGFSGTTTINTGILALGNNNAMGTNQASFANGTTLKATTSLTNVANDIVTSTSFFVNTNGFDTKLAGVISGSGELTKKGKGELTLAGINLYSGGTVVDKGTLKISSDDNIGSQAITLKTDTTLKAGATFASAQNITLDGAATIDTIANTLTENGNIIGPGRLTKTGPGILELAGNNTYTGGTTIKEGKISLIGTGVLPDLEHVSIPSAGASLDTSDSTATQTIGTLSAKGDILIGPRDLFFGNSTNTTISGTFSGSGNIHKQGSGTVTLTGISDSFTGHFFVDAGTLVINGKVLGDTIIESGATLKGTGIVNNLTNDGIFSPGNSIGTTHILGNYTQGGGATLDIEIGSHGLIDLLDITGTASLDGTVDFISVTGSHIAGDTYTFLTAGGGVSGNWANNNLSTLPAHFALIYLANEVQLQVLNNKLFADKHIVGYNPNIVADYLENNITQESEQLINYVVELDELASPSLSMALDRLHPANLGAIGLAQESISSYLDSIFTHHLKEFCCIQSNDSCGCGTYSLWLQPFTQFLKIGPVQQLREFHATIGGFAVGGDRCFDNKLAVGLAAGLDVASMHWSQNFGKGLTNSYFAGIYLDYFLHHFSVNSAIRGAIDFIGEQRNIIFVTTNLKAKNKHKGYEVSAHLGADYNAMLKYLCLTPFANIDAFALFEQGFQESGANALNLQVRHKNMLLLRSELGLNLSMPRYFGNGSCLMPAIFFSYVNIATLNSRNYVANMSGISDQFTTRSYGKIWSLLSPGASITLDTKAGVSLSLDYKAVLDGQYNSNQFDARLQVDF